MSFGSLLVAGGLILIAVAGCGASAGQARDAAGGQAGAGDGPSWRGASVREAGSPPDVPDTGLPPCLSHAMLTPVDPEDGGAGPCTFLVGAPPSAYLARWAIEVALGQELIPQDPSHTSGWDYVAPDYSAIELFGPVCDALTTNPDAGLVVLFLCLVS